MDQTTIVALGVAGVIAPWFIELIKRFIGDIKGKKALTLSMILSVLIAGGVLQYEGKLNFADPSAIFVSAGLVLGVANTVYQYLQGAVQKPVSTVKGFLGM